MLLSVRIVSVLWLMTFGYVWTVGQAGFDATNKNLLTYGKPRCHGRWIVNSTGILCGFGLLAVLRR